MNERGQDGLVLVADKWLDALRELQAMYELGDQLPVAEVSTRGPWRSRILVAAGLALVMVSLPSALAAVMASPPHTASRFIVAVDPTSADLTMPVNPRLRAETSPAPLAVAIPVIGVRAELVDLSLGQDGTLAAPTDFDSPGWYSGGPAPGDSGVAVIVGHVDSYRGPAVFYRLEKLRPGDAVTVYRADGSSVTFTVQRLESYPKDRFPTAHVYSGTGGSELRLITCFGSFDKRRKSYTRNLVVFARLSATTPPQRQLPLRAAPHLKELT